MADTMELVKLAKEVYSNKLVNEKYTKNQATDVLREAFIALNGGSTKLDYKSFRRNKIEIFEILETILDNTVIEGLQDDSFFNQRVDFRNIALGDENSFYVPDNTTLVVSEIADGTSVLRRQRLDNGANVSITTSLKGIKIYEHLSRLLSGRVDFNIMLAAIEKAMKIKMNDDMYNAFVGSFASLPAGFTSSGSFDEETLIAIIDHVEAATGKVATISGTGTALRKITTAVVSDNAKEDMYKLGHYGTFNGTNIMKIRQVHNIGTYTFKLSENDLYITTSDEKPIKFVTEGQTLIIDKDGTTNSDLTQDYFVSNKWGAGSIITDLFGKYEISG